jgi:hypothetical protein
MYHKIDLGSCFSNSMTFTIQNVDIFQLFETIVLMMCVLITFLINCLAEDFRKPDFRTLEYVHSGKSETRSLYTRAHSRTLLHTKIEADCFMQKI